MARGQGFKTSTGNPTAAFASWPTVLLPQHSTAPSVVTPQASSLPAASEANAVVPLGTATAVRVPSKLPVQQSTSPEVFSAHVCRPVEAMDATSDDVPVTTIGVVITVEVTVIVLPLVVVTDVKLSPQQSTAPAVVSAHV